MAVDLAGAGHSEAVPRPIGDKIWSIDMQRYNFQFTGHRFFRIPGPVIEHCLHEPPGTRETTARSAQSCRGRGLVL